MTLKKSICAQTLQNNLAELQRRKDLESLRFFLQHEHCLPPHCDPTTVVITMEELKKLARAWKLHERRNFWKQHSQKTEMVQALLQHIDDTEKLLAMRTREQNKAAAQNPSLSPRPPSKPKPSHYLEGKSPFRENICGYTYFNVDRSPKLIVTNSRFLEEPRSDNAMDHLVDRWRGEDFNLRPDMLAEESTSSLAGKAKTRKVSVLNVSASSSSVGGGGDVGGDLGLTEQRLSDSDKLAKHRNLAAHLANFSKMLTSDPANPGKAVMDVKTAQTFTNVAETDDAIVATYCIIALSNISIFPSVRSMLFEMNALLKVVSLLPNVRDKTAHRAANLMFYYFSCDKEVEDRVFNVCMSSLQNSLSNPDKTSPDVHTRLLNLYTLSNLLESIVDRLRITEMIIPFIRQQCAPLRAGNAPRVQRSRTPSRPSSKAAQSRPSSKKASSRPLSKSGRRASVTGSSSKQNLSSQPAGVAGALSTSLSGDLRPANTKDLDDTLIMFLTVLYNVASFPNTHGPLLSHRVVDVLADIALWAILYQKGDLAYSVSRVMASMAISHDLMKNTESADFASVFGDLLQVDDLRVMQYCVRGLAIMSGTRALLDCVSDKDILTALSHVLGGDDKLIDKEVAMDIAKLITNISQFDIELHSPLYKHIAVVALQLLRKPKVDIIVKTVAIRALQNVYALPSNCDPYDPTLVESVKIALYIAQKMENISAIHTLYNISCNPPCASVLAANEVHIQVLQLIRSAGTSDSKSAYLEVLVQIVGHTDCVNDLLQRQLIHTLFQEIRRKDCPQAVKYDTCRMLMAVVATAGELSEEDNRDLINIMKVACKVDDLNREVSAVVSVVLAFMSHEPLNFEDADTIIQATSPFVDDAAIQGSMSTTLYNMTCDDNCLDKLVKDAGYLNTMIYLMRNSLQDVQQVVAESMRTVSAMPVAVKLLIKNKLLSDLIVVALLRTTSLDIKYACIGCFYNMLCHSETRLELVKGELWWTMMRLGKTDSDEMRHIFAQATFYLSCEAENVEHLRGHHSISFLRDVVEHGCTLEFLETVMRAVLNMYGHMGSGQFAVEFTVGELTSVVHICTEIIGHSLDLVLVTNCLALLVKSIQAHMEECAGREDTTAVTSLLEELDTEFINADFVRILTSAKDIWSSDAACRLYISSLLRDLTASHTFTQAFTLTDIGEVLDAAYTSYPDMEVGQNVVIAIYRCVLTEKKDSLAALTNLTVWDNIMADVLKVPRWIEQAPPPSSHDVNVNAGAGSGVRFPQLDYSFETKTAVIAILSAEVDLLIAMPEKVSSELIEGLMRKEFVKSEDTVENLQYILQTLSTHPDTAERLFDADIIRILRRLLARAYAEEDEEGLVTTEPTIVGGTNSNHNGDDDDGPFVLEHRVCTAVLRNLSLHRKVLRKLAAVQNSELNLLIEDLLHEATDRHYLDISITLYKAATYVLKPEFTLNPQFVLDTSRIILERTTSLTVESIVKSVVGIVLEKFTFGMSVDPTFVQSMFTELTGSASLAVTQQMAQVSFEKIEFLHSSLECYQDHLLEPTVAFVDVFAAAEKMWEPIFLREKKRVQKTVLLESSNQARKYETLDPSEHLLIPTFSKIILEFDRFTPDRSMLTVVPLEDLAEEAGEDDTDDAPNAPAGGSKQTHLRRLSSLPGLETYLHQAHAAHAHHAHAAAATPPPAIMNVATSYAGLLAMEEDSASRSEIQQFQAVQMVAAAPNGESQLETAESVPQMQNQVMQQQQSRPAPHTTTATTAAQEEEDEEAGGRGGGRGRGRMAEYNAAARGEEAEEEGADAESESFDVGGLTLAIDATVPPGNEEEEEEEER